LTGTEQPIGNLTTFRPDIKVLDCTIRDGGLMNNHKFSHDFVRAVYQTCVAAGIDYMEIGYKNSKKEFPNSVFGAWKHCEEEDIRKVVGDNETDLKISVMADAEKSDFRQDITPKKDSVIDMVRVATYIHQIPTAIEMIQDAHDKGYETTCNLMAVSKISETEIDHAINAIAQSPVGSIYVVDSFGGLYPEQIRSLTTKYFEIAKQCGKNIGIHAHNNQALAFANTTEALIFGASRADASIAGLGRGAGNCQTELLIGFLRNPKFNLRPLIEVIGKWVEPLRKELKWGFDIPYMITGQLNEHPRAAMKLMESEENPDFLKFFDEMTESGF
jgi:4-hydroxy 2-oxovalerate aldolase